MNSNDFIMDIIAKLNKQLSRKSINGDLKTLDNTMYVKVIAQLSETLTKKALKQQIKKLTNLELQIGANVKADNGAKKKLQDNIKSLQKNLSDIEIGLQFSKSGKIDRNIDSLKKKIQEKPVSINLEFKKQKLVSDIEYLGKRYSKIFSNVVAGKKFENILNSAYSVSDQNQLANVRAEFQAFTSEIKAHGLAVQSTADKYKGLISKVKDLFSAATLLKVVFSQVRAAISETIDLDKVYTDLIKVNSELERGDYADYLSKCNQKAKELATTQKGLIEGATEFSKSGFDLSTSNKLSEKSTILANVGEMSDSDSAKAIISGVQAYDVIDGFTDVVDKADALISKYNEIGNTASITTAEIAKGVQSVGSVFADANTSVDEFIALLSAGNRQYHDADALALGLRTAALRIRGCSAELADMGEEVDNVYTSTSKLAEKIEGLTNINGTGGVKILEDDGETFRSIYDIFLDISKVYKDMSDTDASALLDLIAGKNRASAISATLNNMAEAQEILQNSLHSAGSAQKEYNTYLESTEAHIQRFKATLTETYTSFLDGNMVSHVVDIGTAVLDLNNKTNLLKHSILAIVALNIGKGVSVIGASIASTAKQMNVLGNALQQVKSLPIDDILREKALEKIGESTQNLTEHNLKLLLSQKRLEDSDKIMILNKHNLTDEEAKLKLEKMGLITATKAQSAANVTEATTTTTLKGAMLSLKASIVGVGTSIKAAFLANPIGISLAAITTLASIATSAISKYNQQLEEARQANIESATTASENANKLKDLYNEYTRLASIQDRTTSEEESFKTAVENITVALGDKAKVLEELVAGTDEYAQALARVTKEELQSNAVTATIGRKSAEEELQGKTWSKWGGSQVSIDSNSKGKALSDEAQKAVDIVSESLKEYETINRTWKNISWDIDSDNPVETLEYYNSLVEARGKLVSASKDDESLLDTEIYEGLNTAINTMSESLDTYIEKLYEEEKLNYMAQNGIPKVTEEYKAMESALVSAAGSSVDLQDRFKELLTSDFSDLAVNIENVSDAVNDMSEQVENVKNTTFDQAWADSFTSENDAVKELANSLLELAEQGRLTIETFNEADSTGYFKNFNISADEVVSKINKLVDESKQLSSMSSQISSMANALGTKQENGFVEADTLAGFDVEVRGLESWDKFQEVLGSTTSSYEECQEAANALATEWVNSSDFLAQLTEQNEEYYKTQLESMGIENYEEVISYAQALNEAKEVLAESSLLLGNATYDEIEALIAEGQYSELTANMILALYDAKVAEQAATLDTSADCANLIALAGDTDTTSKSIQLLIELMNIYSAVESGVYGTNTQNRAMALEKANQIKKELEAIANGENEKIEIEPTVKLGNRGKSSAKSAGKDVGKEIKDGIKDELSDIEGIISSLSKAIDGQKEVITSQKEVALEAIESQISALEEERDARLAAIEAEKKALEDQIEAIDKQIKAKQDEIDAINDAAEARQHEIDLQKAQYELERMQNQRTILQYSEDKGMHYVADESGIRDAKEKVDSAERQLKIDAIEREIDLLENKKDLLNEQIDLLDEQTDNINKFYDSQINALEKQKESTEKYFESLIKSIEGSKSKYEELLEIVDKAELSGKLKQLGIDEEALLNGSEEEFQKLKDAYMGIVFQLNEGNEEVLSSLRELSGYEGTAPTVLSDTTEKLDEMNTELEDSTQSMDKLSTSASTAGEGTSAIATSMGELSTSTEGISDNLTSINDALTGLPEAENINAISDAFTNMGEAIKSVADALGIGEEGTVGGLVGALQSLSELSLGESGDNGQGGGTGVLSQFQALKTAVDDVTNAISGGGSSGSSGGGDASNSSSPSMSSGAGGEGSGGLVGAIESFKSATDEALGSGGEEGEGSDGEGSGAIGQFGQLKTAVDDVTTAIGSGDSEGGEGGSGGEEDAANLIGAINNLGETTEEILAGGGESDSESGGVIGRFEEFKDVIGEANEHVTGISEGLAAIDGQEVECTIKVNIETTGGLPAGLAHSTGTALDTMKLESADYNAKYLGNAHVEGTALATGNWAVQSDEQSALVGEEGFEIIVRNGRFFTVGNTGAEMFPIKRGDIVFNHEQSVNLLKNGHISGRGKAYADGTVGGGKILTDNGEILRPLQPGDKMYDMVQKFDAYFKRINGNIEKLVPNSYYEQNRELSKLADQISYANSITNNRNVQPVVNHINVTCPGVTEQQVAEKLGGVIGKELNKQFSGFHNYVDQQSRIR